MSKITQDFIGNIGSLYEQIHIQDQDFLNEESEYYDEEFAELVENIFYNISYSMASEGYSANGILDFLSKATEEDILEKYFDATISEGLVSEEYILEQLQIIDEGIGSALVKLGRGAVKGTLGFAKRLSTAGSGAIKGGGGVRDALGAMGKSTQRAIKQSGVVTKVKDLAKGAKAALTSPTAKKIGLGAAALGAATGAGYLGGRMSGSGGVEGGPKPTPSSITPPPAPILPPPSGGSGGGPSGGSSNRTSGGVSRTPNSSVNKKYDQLRKSDPEAAKKYGLEQWAKANPKLAAKLNPDGSQKGTGQSQMEKDAEDLRRMTNASKQRQGELMGGPEGPGKIDSKSVDADVKAQQERDRKRAEKTAKDAAKTTTTTVESYDAYDLVLEYLINYGHADTLDEAHYLMLEMDAEMIGDICGI